MTQEYFSPVEAAAKLGVSLRTIYTYLHTGQLSARFKQYQTTTGKTYRRWFIRLADMDKFFG